jgi:hypothetical protein
MSIENHVDPRVTLVRDKYFSLRPKPLEKWLWAAKAPGSAERVFWYHWDIGHQNGSWVSQVPIRVVARECGVDEATVTRAYQWLKGRGLIRRIDAGRDEANPFQKATALTEVFVPRELVRSLAAEPNRRSAATPPSRPSQREPLAPQSPTPPAHGAAVSRSESRRIFQKLSPAERARFYSAQRQRVAHIDFDDASPLTDPERAHVLETLRLLAEARPTDAVTTRPARDPAPAPRKTRLSALQLVELRTRITRAKGEGDRREVGTLLQEIAWSIEQGSLARFERAHALSIACKKVREGAWSTPFGMPAGWAAHPAVTGHCSAAGGN